MDDTRARFLAAIADRLGEDRIVELHLFSPIRQGVLETGVAVVAAEEPVIEEEAGASLGAGEGRGAGAEAGCGAGEGDEATLLAADLADGAEGADSAEVAEVAADLTEIAGLVPLSDADDEADGESPYLEFDTVPAPVPVPESVPVPVPVPVPVVVPEPPARLVVHTARYRLTRKGPDRGKWLFEIGATADAPLATVDMVARGVTLRSKDLTETERLSGEQLRALLREPAWRTPS